MSRSHPLEPQLVAFRSRQPPGLKRWVFEEAGKSEVTGRVDQRSRDQMSPGVVVSNQTVFYVHPDFWGNDSI